MTEEPPKVGMSYTIGGVKVDFPAKAYPSQLSMMDKVTSRCYVKTSNRNAVFEMDTVAVETKLP